MGRLKPTGAAGRAMRAVTSTDWKAKANNVASSLKAEYEAGKQGDEAPAAAIWATPQQQIDGLLALFRQTPDPEQTRPEQVGSEPAASDHIESDEEVADVADAIRGVDWAGVRAATAERTSEATKAMKAMAEQVDWAKVQPVAAHVSSALIAAIATGQLGVGGRLASSIARTITDQGGLGERVASDLEASPTTEPIDFRYTIEAASREA